MNKVFVLLNGTYEPDIVSVFQSLEEAMAYGDRFGEAVVYNTWLTIQEWQLAGDKYINEWIKKVDNYSKRPEFNTDWEKQ